MSVALVILPIALVILTGWAARRSGFVPRDAWPGIETLSFRLLIPAILIDAIGAADLDPARIGPLAISLIGTVAILGGIALAMRAVLPRSKVSNASLSSLVQTSTRWNAFISLAAADLLYGPEGVLLIAVAMAVLIPFINVGNILIIASLVRAEAGWRGVLKAVATNPIIIGCAIGLVLNPLGGLPEPLSNGFQIVGRAALGVGLLAVGAGIEVKRFLAVSRTVVLAVLIRPGLAPLVFLGLGSLAGLAGPELVAGVLATAIPAASNGYIVARKMGGDAELFADILAWQTLASLLALPAYLALAASL
ncbi:hypothetical protein GQ651_01325 [Alphaproteobacteria bacterium GH1-50]|uniref:AEC family transporter n=1 Tax=Kangsaoukella pontilimi TaxID=2691042 RepID=A0A7C9NC78_9RHOB|nr:AEC family transporter [Kangsaoukella pontilimi]MXQ06479.1 hypothetical protein [Kangsaoukella pontilimi]